MNWSGHDTWFIPNNNYTIVRISSGLYKCMFHNNTDCIYDLCDVNYFYLYVV